MSDNNLEIVLSLIDNASAELKKITGDIKKDTESISKESEKASKSLGEGMKEAGKGLKEFKRELFAITAGIAAITMVTKAWAENNFQARQTLDSIGESINKVMGSLGSILSPIIDLTDKALKGIATLLEMSAKGWVGIWGLFKGGLVGAEQAINEFTNNLNQRGNLKEMTDQMKQMTDELSRMDLMYMTGKLTAEQYYTAIISESAAAFQADQLRIQLTKQLAAEENLMRNQSLMDYKADVDARMGLLKTLRNFHHTAYSTMFDFINMGVQKFSTGFTTALTSIIMGTKRAGEAFKEFGIAMITAIVSFVIEYGIQMLIAWALSALIMKATIAQAGAIAIAWLPAAVFASVATLGAAGKAGAVGLGVAALAAVGIMGLSKAVDLGTISVTKGGGAGGGFANGGWVGLHGPEMAMLGERGPEYVIPNNRLGNMGNQTSIHIEINNPVVRSDEDIDKLTEEISLRLAREAERL